MATIDKTVAASSDDATQSGTTVTLDAGPTSPVIDATNEWFAARWDISDAPIPAGATITAATITCEWPSVNFDDPDHPMWFEKTAAPVTFTTGSNDISGRTRTTASVTWSSADLGAPADFTTPDMSAVLQEVVDALGELSAIAWIVQGSADGARDFVVTTYDGSTTLAPRLHIEYTAGGGGGVVAGPLVNAMRLKSRVGGGLVQ